MCVCVCVCVGVCVRACVCACMCVSSLFDLVNVCVIFILSIGFVLLVLRAHAFSRQVVFSSCRQCPSPTTTMWTADTARNTRTPIIC